MRWIERDDEVSVLLYPGAPLFKGRVCYMPAATGDSWVIEDEQGAIHHIQTFVEIVKNKEPI